MIKKLLCLSALGIISCLTSCGLLSKVAVPTTEVSTLAELKEAKGNVILLADIDGQYETIEALDFNSFDGNNHTIKNISIVGNHLNSTAALFGSTGTIKNVVLDNITVDGKKSTGAAIVAQYGSTEISNVIVQNSCLIGNLVNSGSGLGKDTESCYLGGIYAGWFYNGNNSRDINCKITDCKVINTTFKINRLEEPTIFSPESVIGGIAAIGADITNCQVTDCTFESLSSGLYNTPYIGSICGILSGNITNSLAKNNTFEITANYYDEAIWNYYSTCDAVVGGLVGSSEQDSEIKFSYAENNDLDVNCTGSVSLGGLIGTSKGTNITQSYSKNNTLVMRGAIEDNKDDIVRALGGFIGYSSSDYISGCFAYNSNRIEEESNLDQKNFTHTAGFIGNGTKSNVTNCAAYSSSLTGLNLDEFSSADFTISDCYVTSDLFNNASHCQLVGEDFWTSANEIKNNLGLIGNLWQYEMDTPVLNLN